MDLIREQYKNITVYFSEYSAPDTTFLTSSSVHSPGENFLGVEFPDPHHESSALVLATRVPGCILGLFRSHVAVPVMEDSALSCYKLLTPSPSES